MDGRSESEHHLGDLGPAAAAPARIRPGRLRAVRLAWLEFRIRRLACVLRCLHKRRVRLERRDARVRQRRVELRRLRRRLERSG